MTANHRRVRAAKNPKPLAAHLTAATEPEEDRDRALAGLGETRGAGEHKGAVPFPRRDMSPDMAVALGIDRGRPLTLEEFENVLGGRRADGDAQPRRRAEAGARRPLDGYDIVLSAGGSFGAARELAATDAGQALLDGCFDRACDGAMRMLEREVAFTRRGAGGARAEPGEITWVYEDHPTAKAVKGEALGADPGRHRHHFTPNLVVTASGHAGTIDGRRFSGVVKVQGAYFQALLGTELRAAGVRVAFDRKTGEARLAAVPRALVDAFSKRTQAGEADARAFAKGKEAEWGKTWDQLSARARAKLVKAGMRRTQASGRDGMADRWGWRAQAAMLGVPPFDAADPSRPTTRNFSPEGRAARAWAVAQPMLRDALWERPVLSASEVRAVMARAHVATGITSPDDIDRATDMLRTRGVRLEAGAGRVPLVWLRDPARGGAILVTTLAHAGREFRDHVEVPAPGAPKAREPMAALLRRAEAVRVGTVRLAAETRFEVQSRPVAPLAERFGLAQLRAAVRAVAPPPTAEQRAHNRAMLAYRARQVGYGLSLVAYEVRRVARRVAFAAAARRAMSTRLTAAGAVLAFEAARLSLRLAFAAAKGGVLLARSRAARDGLVALGRGVAALAAAPGAATRLRRALDRTAAAKTVAASLPETRPLSLAERSAGIRDGLVRTMKEVSALEARPGVLREKVERAKAASAAPRVAETTAPPRPAPRVARVDEGEAAESLRAALHAAGLRPKGAVNFDNAFHYTPVEGHKGGQNGGYRATIDERGAVATIFNYKPPHSGFVATWTHKGEMKAVPPQEAAKLAARAEADRLAAEREQARRRAEGTERARAEYAAAKPATDQHPYLLRKGLPAMPDARVSRDGALLVPLRDASGAHVNNERVFPDGQKRPVSGAPVQGAFGVVGGWASGQPAVIAEGYATALRLHLETGVAVVMARNAGNLLAVAEEIRAASPALPIVFAADNDHHLPRRSPPLANVGIGHAEAAAKAVGNARVWAAPEILNGKSGTDWDDAAQAKGRGYVAERWREFQGEGGWRRRAQQGREAGAARRAAQPSPREEAGLRP